VSEDDEAQRRAVQRSLLVEIYKLERLRAAFQQRCAAIDRLRDALAALQAHIDSEPDEAGAAVWQATLWVRFSALFEAGDGLFDEETDAVAGINDRLQ